MQHVNITVKSKKYMSTAHVGGSWIFHRESANIGEIPTRDFSKNSE